VDDAHARRARGVGAVDDTGLGVTRLADLEEVAA